jgi:polysaccharide biosynthesis protein PelD
MERRRSASVATPDREKGLCVLDERYLPSDILTDKAARAWWRRTKARAVTAWTQTVRVAPGYVETLIGVAIVSAAGLMIPGHWGLLTLYPHPLWIVVLGIAIRYGAPSGYVAGGLAAISQCLALWLRPEARFQPVPAHALIQPFLFVVVGMVIGQAVRAQQQRLTDTKEKYRQAIETLQTLAQEHSTTHAVKVELEKQIISQPDSVTTLYEMAKKLETLQTDALYPALLDLIQRFMAVEACTYYGVEGTRVHRIESVPTQPADRSATSESPHGLLAQAISERRVVSLRDRLLALGPAALGRESVLVAGPLFGSDGTVVGAITIERLPFLKLTPTTLRLFSLILDWGSTALQNAALYAASRAGNMIDAETGAYAGAHMLRLVRQESRRSDRYRLPLAIVMLEIDRFEAIPPTARAAVARTVVAIVRRDLRTVDILGHHPTPGMFVLVLPMADAQTVQVVVARIDDNLQDAHLRPYGDHRPLVVNYGFLTNRPEWQDAERIVRDVFTDDGGEIMRGVGTAPPPAPRPILLLQPAPFDDLEDRMVGD